jgi:hypothetical protein
MKKTDEAIMRLKSAIDDADRLTTGNVAHKRANIMGTLYFVIDMIEKIKKEIPNEKDQDNVTN